MAITRLSDIISVMTTKWTYGDSKFGYEGEVNETHNTKYPLMLIEPPLSTIPEIYKGREEYDFELNFYNLYSQSAQSVVTLQQRWDNLQDLAMEWLDMVLKNYQDNNVEVFLNDESLEIERVKEVANDRLVQIKINFTMSGFTKCFRPQSFYPSDLSNLVIWLKADSGVTFDIATKRISAWADQSGNSNSVAQATAAHKPLRYGYDGANDKAYIEFDGTNDLFTSDSNSPITGSFTAFAVAKVDTDSGETGRYFAYDFVDTSAKLNFGSSNNKLNFIAFDSAGANNSVTLSSGDTSNYHIAMFKLDGSTGQITAQYNNESALTETISSYESSTVFNQAKFKIGHKHSGAAADYLDGNMEELIIYNSLLTAKKITDVKNYLSNKYSITI